jgi:hypothetical protein
MLLNSTFVGWDVRLFSMKSAYQFIFKEYGKDVAKAFLSCALPAMRSDFFRVFWALSKGGVYSDITFDPILIAPEKHITIMTTDQEGRLRNGYFCAKKQCRELRSIALEILISLSKKEDQNVWSATGPGAFIRAIGNDETHTIHKVSTSSLLKHDIAPSFYSASTWNGENHWSVKQLHMNIYDNDSNVLKMERDLARWKRME